MAINLKLWEGHSIGPLFRQGLHAVSNHTVRSVLRVQGVRFPVVNKPKPVESASSCQLSVLPRSFHIVRLGQSESVTNQAGQLVQEEAQGHDALFTLRAAILEVLVNLLSR